MIRNMKENGSKWIREHANFDAPHSGQEVDRLWKGAEAAGFPITRSAASSAYYLARTQQGHGKKKGRKKAGVGTPRPSRSVNPALTLVQNMAKELTLLTQEVTRLRKVEQAYQAIVNAVERV